MRAKRLDPVGGILLKGRYMALRPIFLVFGKPYVNYVPRYYIFDEYYFAIYAGQGFTLGGIILHQYIGQNNIFIFFSHAQIYTIAEISNFTRYE